MCNFSFLYGSSRIRTEGYFMADLWASHKATAPHVGL
jgi:hypothetical protein